MNSYLTAKEKNYWFVKTITEHKLKTEKNCGAMDIYLFWVLCVVRQRSLSQANHSYRGVIPSVVCLSVMVKLQ
jgi:hypothetical protein